MSIVIHIIKGKRYAYDHFRVGNRIHTKYLYPCNAKGKQIAPEHGGGRADEGKTPPKGAPKARGGARPHKPRPGKPVAPEPEYMGHLAENQEIKRMLDILKVKGVKHLYKWEGSQVGSDVSWSIPGTQESAKVTQSKDISSMNPTTWAVSFGGLHAVSLPDALNFDNVTDATLYARRYMETYGLGSGTLKLLQDTYKDILGGVVVVPPKEQPREPGFTPFEGKKPPVIELPKLPDIIDISKWTIPLTVGEEKDLAGFTNLGEGYIFNIPHRGVIEQIGGKFVVSSVWDAAKDAEGLEIGWRKGLAFTNIIHAWRYVNDISGWKRMPEPEKKKPEPEKPLPPVIKLPEVKLPEVRIPEIKLPEITGLPPIPQLKPVFKTFEEGVKGLEKYIKTGANEKTTISIRAKKPSTKGLSFAEAMDVRLNTPRNRVLLGVEIAGIKPIALSSIVSGLDKSIGRFGIKLNHVGWMHKKKDGAAAMYSHAENFMGGEIKYDHITFQKGITGEILKDPKQFHERWQRSKAAGMAYVNRILADPTSSEFRIKDSKEKLAIHEATKRWTISDISKDLLEVNAVHEGFHAVYYRYDLKKAWYDAVKKAGITDVNKSKEVASVSEYAMTNLAEFFAEVGAAVTEGVTDYDDKVKQAWTEVMGTLEGKYRLAQSGKATESGLDKSKNGMVFPPGRVNKPQVVESVTAATERMLKEISALRDDIYTEEKSNDSAAVKADKIGIVKTMIRSRVEKLKEIGVDVQALGLWEVAIPAPAPAPEVKISGLMPKGLLPNLDIEHEKKIDARMQAEAKAERKAAGADSENDYDFIDAHDTGLISALDYEVEKAEGDYFDWLNADKKRQAGGD